MLAINHVGDNFEILRAGRLFCYQVVTSKFGVFRFFRLADLKKMSSVFFEVDICQVDEGNEDKLVT